MSVEVTAFHCSVFCFVDGNVLFASRLPWPVGPLTPVSNLHCVDSIDDVIRSLYLTRVLSPDKTFEIRAWAPKYSCGIERLKFEQSY